MRLLLNILWLVLSGFWMFLGYVLVGLLWCITIIGIPFGIASFRIGLFALWLTGACCCLAGKWRVTSEWRWRVANGSPRARSY